MAIWILSVVCLAYNLTGCAFAPPPVTQHEIAPVGSHFDAGLVNWVYDGQGNRVGVLVRDEYIANYHWLVAKDGAKLKPPLLVPAGIKSAPNGFWIIDIEHASLYAQMVQMEINP